MELQDIRRNIDSIDDRLVKLFAERMDCAREVAEAKRRTGRGIRDRGREREIVNRLTRAAGDEYAPEGAGTEGLPEEETEEDGSFGEDGETETPETAGCPAELDNPGPGNL